MNLLLGIERLLMTPCTGRTGLIFISLVLAGSVALAQIPTLEDPVTTAFGTYQPPAVEVKPDATWYVVLPDLANVVNGEDFNLPPEAEALLEEQAFFIALGRDPLYNNNYSSATAYKNFEDVYTEAEEAGIPSYVTTDTMLHVFHRLFDHALKTTEEEFLAAETVELAERLISGLESMYDQAAGDDLRTAARLATGHLAVGLLLLDPGAAVPSWLEPELSTELQYIEDAAVRTQCPLFGAYWEDYTQYKPRGHYTRSETLERYFKAMMWYGRMTYALRDMDEYCLPLEQRPDLTAAALLVVRQMLLEEGGSAEVQRWHLIYDPTEFFVGESDDLQFTHYAELAESVYGAPLDQLSPEQICNPIALQTFMDRAETELPQPRIRGNAPQGMRLFGQRFLPDSWYLSELVFDAVGTQWSPRLMPSVLDVMSVLGSVEAEELQRQTGAEQYENYVEQAAMLREDVRTGPPERWAATLYWNWIYSMAPLLGTWGEGFPPYMQSDTWPRRQLMCAAGTWTELRHDTILYVKQSNTAPWTSPPPGAPFIQGAVEPNPWLFARLGALAAYARTGLNGLGILEEQVADKLEDMEYASFLLTDAAVRELERRPLTNEQHLFIFGFGGWLGELLNLEEGEGGVADDENDRSPVVADVHTDPYTAAVLEEGTGYAGRIFVVADVEGRLTLTVGAVFIPFEFTHPADDRLTDEAWWEMLAEGVPEVPWWTHPVLACAEAPAADAQDGAGEFVLPVLQVELAAERVEKGEDLVLSCDPVAHEVRVLVAGSVADIVSVPLGAGATVHVPTTSLPSGEVTLVVDLGGALEYAVRAWIIKPSPRPRHGSGRSRP
ncbi:MAG: DUF3160 domain-containing protein [Thermoanaerobaculales bacterium]|nr:DUF3160 domain-containing protein [Thermoanaerobaculales bacterium]